MKHYDDIDYDQFLYPDQNPNYQPDLHWNFLPASEIAKQAAHNPPQHKILLVPADPNYSPTEDEFWPAVSPAPGRSQPDPSPDREVGGTFTLLQKPSHNEFIPAN